MRAWVSIGIGLSDSEEGGGLDDIGQVHVLKIENKLGWPTLANKIFGFGEESE